MNDLIDVTVRGPRSRSRAEVNDLAEINELIIRRMRTGVMLVDGDCHIRLANEAALLLLGEVEGERNLALMAPGTALRDALRHALRRLSLSCNYSAGLKRERRLGKDLNLERRVDHWLRYSEASDKKIEDKK